MVTKALKEINTRLFKAEREIEPLIMQYGVSIEECAKKFCMSQKTICKILGWDDD